MDNKFGCRKLNSVRLFLASLIITTCLQTSAVVSAAFAPQLHSKSTRYKYSVPRTTTIRVTQTQHLAKKYQQEDEERGGDEPSLPLSSKGKDEHGGVHRRHILLASAAAAASSFCFLPTKPSHARGLVKFPVDDPKQLSNSYHFLTAGETLLQEEDIWSTNPLFLTNREAALTPKGIEQIQNACIQMETAQRTPGVVKYSLAASCIDSANVIRDGLNLGRDRLVPEFTFLDPRGIGMWEQSSYTQTMPAVWAMDALEAGQMGTGGRPPANQDGTPNETLADQSVRLRQVMSILETLYSGECILLIFPDMTGPALLSSMIAGIPYNRVHELEFRPGELRMDVTKESTLQLLKQRSNDSADYAQTIERGRKELERLRSGGDNNAVVNLKDEKMEAERLAIDKEYNEREKLRIQQQEASKEDMLERQRQVEEDRLTNGNPGIPPAALGAAAAVTVGGAFAASGGGEDKKTSPQEKVSAVAGEMNEKEASDPSLTSQEVVISEFDAYDAKPEQPVKPVDPYQAAEKAMQEYLDRDDGAEDWLTVMTEIIDDGEDPELPETPKNNETATERSTKSFE